jgi:hypothetical protein
MPPILKPMNSALVGNPEYDLDSGISEGFLNNTMAQALASGVIPRRFVTGNNISDPDLGCTINYRLECRVDSAIIFSEPSQARRIGVRLKYSGTIETEFKLEEWKFQSASGSYVDPTLDEPFATTFSGVLEATGEVTIAPVDDANVVSIQFSELLRADINNIGDLHFGPDVNELVRRIFERIGIVRLRTTFAFPRLNGLAGSLPGPLGELLGSASGQIGLVDLKVLGAQTAIPDEIHLLLQAEQNLGHQRYQEVAAFTRYTFDVGLAVSQRWTRQILQDLWIGGTIPNRFNDQGRPDVGGQVHVTRLDITFLAGTVQVHATIARKAIGVPITLAATLQVRPYFSGGLMFIELIASDIDISLGWAVNTGWSMVFFALRDIVAKILLRGINELLEQWSLPILKQFIEGRGIDVRRRFKWAGTPFQVDISPVALEWTPTRVILGSNLQLIQ